MLYIRTDANNTIATGHLMRCLAVADEVKELGEDVTFLIADNHASAILRKRGYPFMLLPAEWNHMDSELPVLERLLAEKKAHTILIDSYQVTEYYLKRLTAILKTVYLDDRNAFCYPVNTIICYAYYWKKFEDSLCCQSKECLLGPAYTPLRKEFQTCVKKKISDRAEELLLLSGGTDYGNILEQILDTIEQKQYQKINVICGIYYQDYSRLCEKYKDCKNIQIYQSVEHIKKFMEQADIAVTAGGVTLYELCAAGTPAISYSIADNQLENVKVFHENKIIDYAGDARWDTVAENIKQYLNIYQTDKALRKERSEKMQHLIDGKGAERIARYLTLPITEENKKLTWKQ